MSLARVVSIVVVVVLTIAPTVWLVLKARCKRHLPDPAARTFPSGGLALCLFSLSLVGGGIVTAGNRDVSVGWVLGSYVITLLTLWGLVLTEWVNNLKYYPIEDRYYGWKVSFDYVEPVLGEPVHTTWRDMIGFALYIDGHFMKDIKEFGDNGGQIQTTCEIAATRDTDYRTFPQIVQMTFEGCKAAAQRAAKSGSAEGAREELERFLRSTDKTVLVTLEKPSRYPLERIANRMSSAIV